MKKIISVLLVALLTLSILPLSVLAEDEAFDVSAHPSWTTWQGTGSLVISASKNPDLFKDTKWVNSSGITTQVAVDFGASGLVMENLVVGPGIVFEVRPPHGAPVTIKNCTFKTAPINPGDDYRYTFTILGGHVTLTDNTFMNVYRGLNLRPRGTSTNDYSFTATGNNFVLLPIEGQTEDNIGIQLSGDLLWGPDSVYVHDNRFENASIALRLHSGFKLNPNIDDDEKVITFTNNLMVDTAEGVGLHPSTSESMKEALQEFIENHVEQDNNTFDNCPDIEWNGPVDALFNIRIYIEWIQCSIRRLVEFFHNLF